MKTLKILLFTLIIVESVSAQIVLAPKVSGTCETGCRGWLFTCNGAHISHWGCFQNADSFSVRDGKTWYSSIAYSCTFYWGSMTFNGILEFDIENTIGGASFPPHWMTSNGWTAQLEDLVVVEAHTTPVHYSNPGVDLYNLADGFQDGVITTFDCSTGTLVTNLCNYPPPVGATFSADVTDALRHDLFGPIRYPTSGYILKPRGFLEAHSIRRWSDNPKITITFLSETPTPGPSPTPPTTPVEPTATPESPCDTLHVRIQMPATVFSPGDTCSCHLEVCNPGPEIHTDIPLIVVLDVFGTYFFWPDFTSFDYATLATVPPGTTIIQVLPTFIWPEDAGTAADGVQWIAGMTNPDMTTILGDYGTWEFGWGP